LCVASKALEEDLDGTRPDSYVPDLIAKLLLNLSHDRTVTRTNFINRLRREFVRRAPEINKLGNEKYDEEDEEGPKGWETLGMMDKVMMNHAVTCPHEERHPDADYGCRSTYCTHSASGTYWTLKSSAVSSR
jgi:hypothetical protein